MELPEEKRSRIINAGFKVFGENEFKRASTDEIAAKAGISKGLLFYYFHDKRSFFTFLFERAADLIKEYVVDDRLNRITDFFELCDYAAERKCRMLADSPYILDFIMRAYYSRQEAVSDELDRKLENEIGAIYGTYFKHIDLSKFREDVDPQEIYRMLAWMLDGYMHERRRSVQSVALEDMMEKYRQWSAYFKKIAYREEYLK
jgi:AcrR family transcriptional regulator